MKKLKTTTVVIRKDSSATLDEVLLELAKSLYDDGKITVKKIEEEQETTEARVIVGYYEEETTTETSNKKSTPTTKIDEGYNEFIEDERNPDGIISKLNNLFW